MRWGEAFGELPMPIPLAWIGMLANMRGFAKGGGIGFFCIQSKSRGSVPIWIDDINACTTDEELVDLIFKSTSTDQWGGAG
jgi:hypothetical protein